MKAIDFKGIIPPIQTAFKADGTVDEKGTREIVRFTKPHVDAYYPLGTYGTGPLMNLDERKKVLEILVDEAGDTPIIAHIGAADTKSSVELLKHAKEVGVKAVGSISPYYSPGLSDDLLYQYFMDLMEAAADDIPVFLYNNSHYSQNTISPALLKRLADEGLRGCKDSSFDLVNFYNYQEAVKEYPDFNVIIGTEAIFVGAFMAGATGCVCGIGNIYPELMAKMYKEFVDGDLDACLESQRLILKIRGVIKMGPTIPIMHAILELRGVDAGLPRRPYLPLADDQKAVIKKALQAINVL